MANSWGRKHKGRTSGQREKQGKQEAHVEKNRDWRETGRYEPRGRSQASVGGFKLQLGDCPSKRPKL